MEPEKKDGYMTKCKECGNPYGPLFIWVADEVWKNLGYETEDYVCDHCLIDKLKQYGYSCCYLCDPYETVNDIGRCRVKFIRVDYNGH